MTPSARLSAAISVLDDILAGQSAEQALTSWGRASRYAGSGDRHAVRDLVFDALRCKASFGALGGAMTGRGLILGGLRASGGDVEALFSGQGHAPHTIGPADNPRPPTAAEALDLPEWLLPELQRSLDDVPRFAAALKARAPVFLRANRAKVTAADLMQELAEGGVQTTFVQNIDDALQVIDGARKIASLPAMIEGRAELQDAASQGVIAALKLPKSGRILDFCAGGGGKILNIASQLHDNDKVSLFAYDANARRMSDLPARADRAGARISVLNDISNNSANPDGYDLILCDVPCSGAGSWRRDPQGKWALTPEKLETLRKVQADILDQAATLLAPNGQLAYSTCSVLRSENEDQVSAFLDRHPNFDCHMSRRLGLGDLGGGIALGGDGFFVAVLGAV